MKRKDGKRKLAARRVKPEYTCGFMESGHWKKRSKRSGKMLGDHPITTVSLFSGCGGLDLGLQGGFDFLDRHYDVLPFSILAALDNSEDAVETYQLNLGQEALLADLTTYPIKSIPKAEVLTGGFPCQDFSSSGPKSGLNGKRGQLYKVLSEYMEVHRPKLVIAENVPHLARLSSGAYLKAIIRDFESKGYAFDVWDLYAPDFGLPQSRRRLFLIGVRDDISGFPEEPVPSHYQSHVPINEGLADLESVVDESVTNQGQYYVATRASSGGGQGDHTNKVGKVAYCIRANARGRIQFHYSLDRRLTVRECARLQSFPDQFVFPYSTQRNLTLIGNAVPPILGHHVGRSIANFLNHAQTVAQGKTEQMRLTISLAKTRDCSSGCTALLSATTAISARRP